jgi:hypothetical protein
LGLEVNVHSIWVILDKVAFKNASTFFLKSGGVGGVSKLGFAQWLQVMGLGLYPIMEPFP